MQHLNLPPITPKIKQISNRSHIFDKARKSWVVLTPEEWVRQHVIDYLVEHKQYPIALMKVESGHRSNVGLRRTDIIVCNKEATPVMLVECKAPTIKITQDTVEQIANYNQTIRAKYLLISNGLKHIGFKIDFESGEIKQLIEIPFYSDL